MTQKYELILKSGQLYKIKFHHPWGGTLEKICENLGGISMCFTDDSLDYVKIEFDDEMKRTELLMRL
jgi:hypothetical protein